MTEPQSVTLSRIFKAPIDLVWRAFTDGQEVDRWMKCEPGVEVIHDPWQPAVGAEFAAVMRKPGEWEVTTKGRFLEVDPPRRLAYESEPDPKLNMPSMAVLVHLEEVAGGTKVTLTQSGIPGDDMCRMIEGGWSGGFAQLEERLVQQLA